jgi:hypothetical protein
MADEVHEVEQDEADAKPYGDGKVYVVNLDRSLEQKAKDGYERMRAKFPFFAGEPRTPWSLFGLMNGLSPQKGNLKYVWMNKAREVEANPEPWLSHDSPDIVEFAKGVLQLV